MGSDFDGAERDARSAAEGSGLVERIAGLLGVRASASAVFGDPVERAGVTVIPVARVRWGFGGGSGSGKDGEDEGGGGGGGVSAKPVGYIEVRDGSAIFRRIPDPGAIAPLIVASGLAGWLVLRGLRRLFR